MGMLNVEAPTPTPPSQVVGGNVHPVPLPWQPPAGPAEPAILVTLSQRMPAVLLLTEDVGFGCLALCLQCVELLLESFFGRFAGINGAADCWLKLTHASTPA